MRSPRSGRSARGATLVEGMAAAAVLAIGILGAMQSLITASQQNSTAQRMVRAAQIADLVRTGLEMQRYSGLTAPGKLITAANCSSNPAVLALAGGLQNVTVPSTPCIIDLDAFDAVALPADVIAPGFTLADTDPTTTTDGDVFRRVLVVTPDPTAGPNTTGLYTVTVVVSFRTGTGLSRATVQQTAALYDPATNQSGADF